MPFWRPFAPVSGRTGGRDERHETEELRSFVDGIRRDGTTMVLPIEHDVKLVMAQAPAVLDYGRKRFPGGRPRRSSAEPAVIEPHPGVRPCLK